MVRTQIQLTEDQVRALKELSHQKNSSMADLIRQAVDYWLRAVDPVSLEERRRRAIAAADGFPSGLTDLSEHHDDYLAEIYGEISE
jgi:hypothetical protein